VFVKTPRSIAPATEKMDAFVIQFCSRGSALSCTKAQRHLGIQGIQKGRDQCYTSQPVRKRSRAREARDHTPLDWITSTPPGTSSLAVHIRCKNQPPVSKGSLLQYIYTWTKNSITLYGRNY